MSDAERRALARQAGDGDFNAAVALVVMIMRETPAVDPTQEKFERVAMTVPCLCPWSSGGLSHSHPRVVEKPPTAEALRARTRLSAHEIFRDRLSREQPDPRDTLARWLVAHNGKVIRLCEDPVCFEAVEPAQRIKDLEEYNKRLLANYVLKGSDGRVIGHVTHVETAEGDPWRCNHGPESHCFRCFDSEKRTAAPVDQDTSAAAGDERAPSP